MEKPQTEATTKENLEEKFGRGQDVLDYFDVEAAKVLKGPRSASSASENASRKPTIRDDPAKYGIVSKKKHPKIPWQRFWVYLGGTVDCDMDGGFLTDPEDRFGRFVNPTITPLPSVLPEFGPLALCGEPGIGKSTELENALPQLMAPGESCQWIVFRDVSDLNDFRRRPVDHADWKTWREGIGRMSLVVDGVDEGLLRVPNFVNDLRALLQEEPLDRLRLILACRTAEWPLEMGARVFALWAGAGAPPIYELCPLRRTDAELAARMLGVDSDAFMTAVWERHVTVLAARPVTLFFLIDEFQRHGGLPATHRQLYERGTANLAREVDPARLDLLRAMRKTEARVTDAERLRAAQRLAAVLLLSGRSAVQISGGAFGADIGRDLSLENAAGAVALAALEEAVESALFTSVGERRFGFVHHTFAECLASQYLATLPLIQLRQLLCQWDARGEHVIPQLSELAAWTAGNHPEFLEHLLRIEPEILLRSDLARYKEDSKLSLSTRY